VERTNLFSKRVRYKNKTETVAVALSGNSISVLKALIDTGYDINQPLGHVGDALM
jgi:hypothetical protein